MSRSRCVALPLVLGLFAGTACYGTITGYDDICLHSEGCGPGSGNPGYSFTFSINGVVTSATTGKPLQGVTVHIEAPAPSSSETVLTDGSGRYSTIGFSNPTADCTGVSVSFSREGYESLQVVDFSPGSCGSGPKMVNASLTPTS